jgi:hypothetical protein
MALTVKCRAIEDKRAAPSEADQHTSHENEVWQSVVEDAGVMYASIGTAEISVSDEEDQPYLTGLESLRARAMDADEDTMTVSVYWPQSFTALATAAFNSQNFDIARLQRMNPYT